MKKLSTYLFLLLFSFQASSWADDISDFEIEGMSIGDSLLDYFSKKEIKDNTLTDYYTNNEYTPVEFFQLSSFKTYDSVGLRYKTDDKKYIIVGISGTLFCKKNIEKCNKKQKEIDLKISNMFENAQKDVSKDKHSADKSGKSNVTSILYWFKSGDYAAIDCIDWSSTMKPRTDNLNISLVTKELNDWLTD